MSMLSKTAGRLIPSGLRNRVHTSIWQRLNLRYPLQSDLTINIHNYADWIIYNDIFVLGEYDVPIKALLQSQLHGHKLNILDIGANVGFFTLRFIDLVRRSAQSDLSFQVTLVEGSPTLVKDLEQRLIKENSLSSVVTIVHGLVGKRDGVGKIAEYRFHGENTIFFEQAARSASVRYIDITSLFSTATEVDLLKCDIEGAELSFIENYRDFLPRVKTAVFELHHDKCDTQKCISIISESGLTKHKILRVTAQMSVCYFWK